MQALDPSIEVDLRYAGSDNFVGTPVAGYEAPKCLLSRPAAEALVSVQKTLAGRGYGLRAFDCYRPQRAVDHFVRWARDTTDRRTKAAYYPDVAKSALFADGYIAERSGHSRGSTVDLTLIEVHSDGSTEPLDMGTPFDFFDPSSATDSPDVTPRQRADRALLREYMEAGGFRNYEAEWWHYTLEDEPWPDRYLDVVIR
jgi:D-alanyl-D-alanine dipeptidase